MIHSVSKEEGYIEMKEYFISPVPFIGPLVFPTFILGALGVGSITTGVAVKVIGGVVCILILVCLYTWAIYQVRSPAVKIFGDTVEVRGLSGRRHRVDDVRNYFLVLSSTWIGFRRKGQQDVMIGKSRFSKKTWLQLEDELRKLPVAGTL